MKRATHLAIAIAGAALAACGGGTESQSSPAAATTTAGDEQVGSRPVHEKGATKAQARMGPGGGSLELANGARLEIPPGTLQEPETVVLTEAKPTMAFANYDDQEPVGPAVSATPALEHPDGEKIVFSAPRQAPPEGFSEDELVLAVETVDEEQRAFGENTTVTRWAYEPASIQSGRMRCELPLHPGLRLQFLWSKD